MVTWLTTVVYILSTKSRTLMFDKSPTVEFVVWNSWKPKIWRQIIILKMSEEFILVINLTPSDP